MVTLDFDDKLRFVPRSSFHGAAPCTADQATAPAALANASGPRPITALPLPAVGPARLAAAAPCASASWPVAVVCRVAASLPVLAAQAFAHLLSTLVLSAVLLWAFAVRFARDLSERTGATSTGSNRSGINLPCCDAAEAEAEAAAAAVPPRSGAGARDVPDDLQASLENLRRAEVVSSCARDYARHWSFDWEEQHVVTADGFFLEMQRITAKGLDKRQLKGPILCVHGMFQSSGVFVTNEEKSMAFYFAERGYDVWLGNNRGVTTRHAWLDPSSLQFWDWSLDEISRHDFPTMIDYVLRRTGREKLVYVGHSQGNAQAFMGLNFDAALARKISCFVSLAPAVYLGPLMINRGVLRSLLMLPPDVFALIFGHAEFVPLMSLMRAVLPAGIFATLAFEMFAYLFDWKDHNWQRGRKIKYFRFMPRPTSVRAVRAWLEAARRSQLAVPEGSDDASCGSVLSALAGCPVAVFYGGRDLLIDGNRLVREMKKVAGVRLLHAEEIPHYDHLDPVLAHDADRVVWAKMVEVLEKNCLV